MRRGSKSLPGVFCTIRNPFLHRCSRLRGRTATQRSGKGSEKVLGRVLGKGFEKKGSEKGAFFYGFYSKKKGSEKAVSRRGSEKAVSRRCLSFAPVQPHSVPVQAHFRSLSSKDLLHPLLTTFGTLPCSGAPQNFRIAKPDDNRPAHLCKSFMKGRENTIN